MVTWHTSYFTWACCILSVYTVYSRPLKSFIFSLIEILFSLRPTSNLCKQVKNEPLVLCHFLVLGMTDVSALPLSRMFDNLLVLNQNLSALDPDLRPSVSSVHLINQTQLSYLVCACELEYMEHIG